MRELPSTVAAELSHGTERENESFYRFPFHLPFGCALSFLPLFDGVFHFARFKARGPGSRPNAPHGFSVFKQYQSDEKLEILFAAHILFARGSNCLCTRESFKGFGEFIRASSDGKMRRMAPLDVYNDEKYISSRGR